ncbi:MAG: AMP-binding protein, partial [Ktedonobacterales bacterium]
MQGLMMDYPLTVQHIFTRATRYFPRKEVVTKTADGLHRYTYGDFGERTTRLASTLRSLGVQPGDRVGTFGWNTYRHLELYFAVPCMGAVLHTLNIRLFTEQLEFVINDAEDKVIVVDADLLPLLEKLAGRMPTVRAFIVMGKPAEPTRLAPAYDYEALLASSPARYDWPTLDENDAAAMCYTSGTTGNPKGVVYSHRSTFLHSFGACLTDSLGVCERDTVMPVVPMFHANAWGLVYTAALIGSPLVLPGPRLDAVSVLDLLAGERVTITAGVPTVWMAVLAALVGAGLVLPGSRLDADSVLELLQARRVTITAGVPTVWMALLAAYRELLFGREGGGGTAHARYRGERRRFRHPPGVQ